MIELMIESEYSTRNLNIAAYLFASGVRFAGAKKEERGYLFKFTPTNKAEELVNSYFLGSASVNPKELFARLNDLRDLIFNQGRVHDGEGQF